MRKKMGLFANLRPAKVIPQLIDASSLKKEVIEGVDIMVVSMIAGTVARSIASIVILYRIQSGKRAYWRNILRYSKRH